MGLGDVALQVELVLEVCRELVRLQGLLLSLFKLLHLPRPAVFLHPLRLASVFEGLARLALTFRLECSLFEG